MKRKVLKSTLLATPPPGSMRTYNVDDLLQTSNFFAFYFRMLHSIVITHAVRWKGLF